MPAISANGTELHYVEAGAGPETVVLSHSYLVDHRHFDPQIEALKQRYRVLAYDHRGHGESATPPDGYDMENLYADAVAFIEQTEAAPCHFIGLSAGGFIGARLGFRRPDLLRSLVLMDTSAGSEPLMKRIQYGLMLATLRAFGFRPLMRSAMPIMFGPRILGDPERASEVALWRERIMANDRGAMVRFGRGIFARDSVLDRLHEITTPTLAVVGECDRGQPPDRARDIVRGIAGAELAVIPHAGHLSTIDEPEAVTNVLVDFIGRHSAVQA
jgi:pimeloyl-ACP methyl ester carboxylesterase